MTPEMIGSVLLATRIGLAGCWWYGSARGKVSRMAAIMATGFAVNLLPAVLLAPMNLWTPVADWLAWGGLVMVGLIASLRRGRKRMGCAMREGFVVSTLLMIMYVAISLWPARSEWVAGGWDPGLYVNLAVTIAQHNGIAPDTASVYADMTREERLLVSFTEGTYREVLPGVPIDVDSGALPRYFFHLTSLAGALFFRLGDYALLFRMPVLLAFMGVPAFIWLAGVLGLKRWSRAFAGVFWFVSPVWWYQQAIPTTEMLYLFLMMSGLAFYLEAHRDDGSWPFMAGWLFFLATINHFNFPVLAGIFMLVTSVAEVTQAKHAGSKRIAPLFVFVLLGIAWDFAFARVTLDRLEEKDAAIRAVLIPFFFSSLMAFLIMRSRPCWLVGASWLSWLRRATGLLGFAVAVALFVTCFPVLRNALMDVLPQGNLLRGFLYRSSLLGSFLHPGALFLATAGLFNLAWREHDGWRHALGLFLVAPGIAPIYPWGLRRFVPVLLPFMALAQSGVMAGWVRGSKIMRVAGVSLLAGGLTGGMMNSNEAIRAGDYRGLHAVMEQLSSKVEDHDVVLVDDHRFATPLLLMYGHDVLLDRIMREHDLHAERETFQKMLMRLIEKRGGRLLWLTTTGDPPSVFFIAHSSIMLTEEQVAYPLIVHSLRGNHFRKVIEERSFILHCFEGFPGD